MTRRRAVGFAVAALIALGMFPVVSTQPGADAVAWAQGFLEYSSGVFALLAFTGAVVWGLIAAERIMSPRHRLLAQGIHRMLGTLGLGFLGTHIVLQILAERAGILDAVVPFIDTKARLVATGLGTIASDLMIVVFAIGTMRGRFAASSRPWLWRVLHGIAYLSWPIAITHGLSAGRPGAAWVSWSYVVCLVAVVLAVLIRLISPFPITRAARRLRGEFDDLADERPRRRERRPPPPRRPRGEPATQPLKQVDADLDADSGAPARERTRPGRRPTPAARPMPRERPPARDPLRTAERPAERPGERPREAPRIREPLQPATGPRPGEYTPPMPGTWTRTAEPAARASAPPPAPASAPAPAPASTTRRVRPVPDDRPEPARPQTYEGDETGGDAEPGEWWRFRRRQRRSRERPLIEPDLEEVEFWAALRAETSIWIRRGRR